MKKLLLSVTLSAVVGALLLFISSRFGSGDSTARPEFGRTISSETADKSGTKRFEKLQRRKRFQSLLLAQCQCTKAKPTATTDRDAETREYRKMRNKAISPYYWDFAPKVLAGILELQPHDRSYSEEMKRKIDAALSQGKYKGTTLDEIECGESLCRAMLSHEDTESFKEFQDTSNKGGPWGSDLYGTGDDGQDNTMNSTLYFARDGYTQEPFEEMRDNLYQKVLNKEVP